MIHFSYNVFTRLKIKSRQCLVILLSAALCLIIASCSSGGSDSNQSGDTPGSTVPANFASIERDVLVPNCTFSGCHSGSLAQEGLQLDAGVAYANLVSVISSQQADILRVAPGDPDNSYLVRKLEGTASTGLQMPRNMPPLPAETIQAIRDWIANGALLEEAASAL